MNGNDRAIALVTGASSGIGYATARALQKAGYHVFGSQRGDKPVRRSDGVVMLSCDVTDDAAVTKLVHDVLGEAGRIDLLVNNAGIGMVGGAEESSIAQAQALFDVNVFGLMRLTKAVLPVMRRQRKGRIINIGSILGLIPSHYNAIYSSTKHAIEGYSESLDHETRAFGVRIVVVEPAYTNTTFEKNKSKPDQPLPIYEAARTDMERFTRQSVENGDAPEVVAETVVKAATAAKPKRRYPAGKTARQIRALRRFVPESAFDRSLRKQSGLPV